MENPQKIYRYMYSETGWIQLLEFLEENYSIWKQNDNKSVNIFFESLTGGSPYSLNTLQSNTAPLLGAGPTLESLQSMAAASCVLSMLWLASVDHTGTIKVMVSRIISKQTSSTEYENHQH